MNFIVALLSAGYIGYLIAAGYRSPAMFGAAGIALLAVVATIYEDRS
jgi:energy-converting hydrogenase Eha subunit C